MGRLQRARYRVAAVIAVLGISLLVAACGSSSSGSSTSAAATSASAGAGSTATAAPASARGTSIATASGDDGTYLTAANGRVLYLWEADAGDMSSCSGKCAKAWPPLTTNGKPSAGSGVKAADLGTIKRSDGTTQVTYKGHPLYYFIEDTAKGSLKGQGSDSFGADWFIVAPSGAAIKKGDSDSDASSTSSSSSDSSGSSGGGGGGGGWG